LKIEVTTEELSKYSLFVATPMYGGACSGGYAKSISELSVLCAQYGIKFEYFILTNESLIARARNYCADAFLRSKCTHMLFIDSDIIFNAKDALSLLAIISSKPEEYDIIAGTYPKKSIAWDMVKLAVERGKAEDPNHLQFYTGKYVFNAVEGTKSFKISEPVEVSEVGTGFMLVPREAFEKYAEKYDNLRYKPDHLGTPEFDGSREITAFFHCDIDPKTKRYLSEDYYFCQKAREIGLKIHMCPWMQLNHVGSYVFRGSIAAMGSLS
jgi:hypothetical protein